MELSKVRSLKEYEVISERDAGDINSQGMLLVHKKSGARVFLL